MMFRNRQEGYYLSRRRRFMPISIWRAEMKIMIRREGMKLIDAANKSAWRKEGRLDNRDCGHWRPLIIALNRNRDAIDNRSVNSSINGANLAS